MINSSVYSTHIATFCVLSYTFVSNLVFKELEIKWEIDVVKYVKKLEVREYSASLQPTRKGFVKNG